MPEDSQRQEIRAFPRHMREAQFQRTEWMLIVQKGAQFKDVLELDYWSLISQKLRPWDIVSMRDEAGTWYAQVVVLDCAASWARVRPLYFVPLVDEPTAEGASDTELETLDYQVLNRGKNRWSVVRESDRALMVQGLATRADAEKWVVDFVRDNPVAEVA